MLRLRDLAVLLALAGAGLCAAAPVASAYLYWANSSSIIRANNDGSSPVTLVTAAGSQGVAVDGSHVYWAANGNDRIGRANLDGTGANPNFITTTNITDGVAVDGSHVYWADAGQVAVGRANLDGSGVVDPFIIGANTVNGVAVDAHHIYWANYSDSIGRANLDGSGVNQNFISLSGSNLIGLAVDSGHIYWTESHSIGRANLDGSGVNQSFIADSKFPGSLVADGQFLYWVNEADGTIGRANLDGTGVTENLATGGSRGIAVDHLPFGAISPSPSSVDFGSQPLGLFGAPQSITVTNAKFGVIALGQASLTGVDADDFLITSDTCSQATLWIDESCHIDLRYGPSASGARSATLSLPSDDPSSPLLVSLSGSGGTLPQGPAGATGPQGPAGATGPAGKIELVTCRTLLRKVKGHIRRVKRCTAKLVSGTVKFTAAVAHATVSRAGTTYARGVAISSAAAGGHEMRLLLDSAQALPAGHYTLTLGILHGRHWLVRREAITLG